MKRKSSALLLLMMLLMSMPMVTLLIPNASADPISIGVLSPNHGPVKTRSTPELPPTEVLIEGVADYPDTDVEILWDNVYLLGTVISDGDRNFRTTFDVPDDAVFGEHLVYVKDMKSGLLAWRPFYVESRIEVTPKSGIVGSTVRIDGSGFAGESIVQVRFYVTSTAFETVATTTTNEWGTFRTYFTVPSAAYGSHVVRAIDENENYDDTSFSVTQSFYVEPSRGPVGEEVTLTGFGWRANQPVSVIFDSTPVGSKTADAKGFWTLDWTIPLLPALPLPPSEYTFTARHTTTPHLETPVTFILDPKIVSNPDHGSVNDHIVVTGTGFTDDASVDVYFEDGITPIRIWGDEDTGTQETNASGWFEFAFTVPNVSPGEYTIRAIDEYGFVATATFIVGPWVVLDRYHGHVGMKVSVNGYVFKRNSYVDIYFDGILVVPGVPTDKNGDFFAAKFDVPEVPRGSYPVRVIDPEGTVAWRDFFVYPWMVISPKSGIVGTEITIDGWGFPAEENVQLWYGGVAGDRLNYEETYYVTWDGYDSWEIRTVGDDYLLMTILTNEKGSFEDSFAAPESWGGYHPIWARWWSEEEWMYALQEQIFRILPSISITPASGVSGQYVHLDGTGFSTWEYYEMIYDPDHNWVPDDGYWYVYERSGTHFVLDFGSVQRYIDEAHFILNNEANVMMLPIFGPEGGQVFVPLKIDARGTIIYYDALYNKVSKIGCPFLQVPFLQPGDYTVTAYRFNEWEAEWLWWYDYLWDFWGESNEYSFDEKATTTFTIEPLKVDIKAEADRIIKAVEEQGKNLKDLIVEVADKLQMEHEDIIALIGEVADKLQMEHEELADLIAEVFDELGIKLDDIKIQIEEKVDGLYLILDEIELKLEDINATLTEIKGGIAEIQTTIGKLKLEDLSAINAKLDSLEDDMATVLTDLGTCKTTLTDINTKITVTKDNVATIQTDIGTIKGTLTTIQGDIATIKTDIGTVKTSTSNIEKTGESIKTDTSLQPATVALSLIAAISAIAAAVMVLRKVYMK